ncbi:MAG: acyl-ACP--UDP-N-acetylglucosamine O-acyltransferase [Pirellulaceae bacterium]
MPHNQIHPTAVVASDAVLGRDVHIGAYSVVESKARLGDGCRLECRVVVKEGVVLGSKNEIHDGAVVGGRPQHLKAGDRIGGLRIGDANTIRENVTIHRALQEGQDTLLGDHNLVMVNAHVAHDCHIGDHTIITNNVMLAGHILVEDRAYISGGVGVHQFLRVGRLAMIGGMCHIKADVPPYVLVDGDTSKVVGLNVIGLRRNGFTSPQINEMKAAYRVIYRSGLRWEQVLQRLEAEFPSGPAAHFFTFLSGCQRGCVQERRTPRHAVIPIKPESDDPTRNLRIRKAS